MSFTLKKITIISCLLILIAKTSFSDEIRNEEIETNPSDFNTSEYVQQVYDPLEPLNRVIFKFNNVADRIVLEPVAKGYRKLPSPVQSGVGNFFSNLRLPLVIVNQFLQGQFGNAASHAEPNGFEGTNRRERCRRTVGNRRYNTHLLT